MVSFPAGTAWFRWLQLLAKDMDGPHASKDFQREAHLISKLPFSHSGGAVLFFIDDNMAAR